MKVVNKAIKMITTMTNSMTKAMLVPRAATEGGVADGARTRKTIRRPSAISR
jgi:hypothetical protein